MNLSYNSKLALEYFVTLYDNMEIADESAHAIKKMLSKEKKEIENLKKEVNKSKGNTPKMLSCYEKALSIIMDIRDEVDKMDVNAFEKGISYAGTILTIVSGVGTAIGLRILFHKIGEKGVGIIPEVTGGLAALGMGKLTKSARKLRNTKSDVLYKIDETIHQIKCCIEILKNPTKYQKYFDFDINDLTLDNAETNYIAGEAGKIITLLINELNKKFVPKLNKIGIKGKFIYDKNNQIVIHSGLMDKHSKFIQDIAPDIDEDLAIDAQVNFCEFIDAFEKAHIKELKEAGVTELYLNPDVELIVNVNSKYERI